MLAGHIIGKEIASSSARIVRSEIRWKRRKNGASLPDSLTLMEIFVACFVLQDLPLFPPLQRSLPANSKVMKIEGWNDARLLSSEISLSRTWRPTTGILDDDQRV